MKKYFQFLKCFFALLILYIDIVLSKDIPDLSNQGSHSDSLLNQQDASHLVEKRSSSALKRLPGWSVYYGKRSGNIDLDTSVADSVDSGKEILDSDVISNKFLSQDDESDLDSSSNSLLKQFSPWSLKYYKQELEDDGDALASDLSVADDDESSASEVNKRYPGWNVAYGKRRPGWYAMYGKRAPQWLTTYGKRAPQWLTTYGKRAPQWLATYGKRAPQWLATYGKRAPQWLATYGKRAPQWLATYGKRAPQWLATYGKRAPQWLATYGKRAPQWLTTYGKRLPGWTTTYGKRAPQWLATYGKRPAKWQALYGKRDQEQEDVTGETMENTEIHTGFYPGSNNKDGYEK